ncbi:hypothetical protein DPEC_G00175560 [Dallia pectoralis]|uniref:Uncharacterized protein n=1 Tax=Dallia pectoralis TaxID=75939 RepID=A0ACC2GEE9_DALPE|nr:hypothetical protein DPEC_G00175560 [Dallia pectoralis]
MRKGLCGKDAFPLPRIEESLDSLSGARWFSTLDLASGYNQVKVADQDQHKTAFCTPFGLYEFSRMAFGLCNAPGTFQRLMERILAHGVSTDPGKIQAVKEWKSPQSLAELKSFLGFASFYRRFVKNFACIAPPLHALSALGSPGPKKAVLPARVFCQLWDSACEDAFQGLKLRLTSAPVLGYADFTKPFVLEIDASHQGLGAVLSQELDGQRRPVAYASRGLRASERNMDNYSAMKLELLGLKWAVTDKFREYLLERRFTVLTDNNPLSHLKTAKLGAVEQRWVSELARFVLSYSVAVGKIMKNLLYFTGTPRSEHMGKVLLFKKVDDNWNLIAKIPGEQIGSYFGAELCSVDIDSDGNTDFLLVGAPLFHQPQREGKIYVYRLTDKLDLMPEMNVSVPSSGRFGSSISSLSDLNGDGLNDVAVGAPLEDNHSGAVYIYLGERLMGIRPKFSQRISASMMKSQKMPSNLQFFGQTIDGKIDLGEDGLPDIVVGARGAIVVLRSRSVLNVTAKIHFHPSRISTYNFDCLAKDDTISHEFTITVCFNIAEATQSNDGTLGAGMNISYLLDVDPVRQRSRAFYSVKDKDARRHLSTVELRDAKTCFNHSVYMTASVIDTLSPIIIKMIFSQTDSQLECPTPILNTDSLTQAVVEVPFEKNFKRNETCVADLQVDFSFINSTIVVDEQSYCIVAIRLYNQGDDSYNTSLTLLYPPGLSFSMMSLVKSTRRTLINCGQDDEAGKTTCTVSLPVFRSQTTAEFHGKFHISNTHAWIDTIEMTVIGKSDNGKSTNSSLTKTIPVRFAVDLLAKAVPKKSITYVNFTLRETSPKKLLNVYEVQNLGSKSLPIKVVFIFPTTLGSKLKLKDYQISVSKNHTQCGKVMNSTTEFCSPEKNCKSIKCESFILEQSLTVTFKLSGSVAIKDLKQHAQGLSLSKKFTGDRESVHFITFVKVNYDKKRYIQTSSDRRDYANATSYHQTQIEVLAEIIIPPDRAFIIGIGVTGGLLLLTIMIVVMYKVGFFKRNRGFGQIQEEQEVDENCDTAVAETGSENKSHLK